jgi:hypothetical protein
LPPYFYQKYEIIYIQNRVLKIMEVAGGVAQVVRVLA